jgi:hypothetical protein
MRRHLLRKRDVPRLRADQADDMNIAKGVLTFIVFLILIAPLIAPLIAVLS